MPRAFVLGSPIRHSLSPVLHRAAYASLGLTDWTYDAADVDRPASRPSWPGWARTCAALADDAAEAGGVHRRVPRVGTRAVAGAINTLVRAPTAVGTPTTPISRDRGGPRGATSLKRAVAGRGRSAGAETTLGRRRRSGRDCPLLPPSPRHFPDSSPFAPSASHNRVASWRANSGAAVLRVGVILGRGDSAVCLIALRELGCRRVTVCARNPEKAWASLGAGGGSMSS